MGETKIEWADAVWNPVTGCTPISEGCQHCYARRMATRLRGRAGYPADDPFRVTFHPDRLDEPLRWKKARRIFVCSMGDLFHEDVRFDWLEQIWQVMFSASQHTYLIITKRPERAAYKWHDLECLGRGVVRWEGRSTNHIWLGTSVENQAAADKRIPWLLKCPVAVRFLSCEPLLGVIRLHDAFLSLDVPNPALCVCGHGHGFTRCANYGGIAKKCHIAGCKCTGFRKRIVPTTGIHGVIVGGESGPGARPMHPDWVRTIREQCQAAGVPFFFKQWGEWAPQNRPTPPQCHPDAPGSVLVRVGKKAAGRLLDGREWNELPQSQGDACVRT